MRKLLCVLTILLTSNHCFAENYAFKDGQKYGYERNITKSEKNEGTLAVPMVMAIYLGKRDNKYQAVVINSKQSYTVLECKKPCKYLKLMNFQGDNHQNTEWIKTVPNMIAALIMDDAINGRLEQYIKKMGDVPHHAWVNEDTGRKYMPIKK